MYPDQIQAYVKTRIEAHPKFADLAWLTGQMQPVNGQAVPNIATPGVILDDGTYPKIPGHEALLADCGLSIVAWQIGCFGLKDGAKTGTAVEIIHAPVLIQENEKVNRDPANPNATRIVAERAMQYIKEAVSGFPKIVGGPSITFTPLLLWHQPFEDFGVMNGTRTILVNFYKEHRINPLPA